MVAVSWRRLPGTLLPPGGEVHILQEECSKENPARSHKEGSRTGNPPTPRQKKTLAKGRNKVGHKWLV